MTSAPAIGFEYRPSRWPQGMLGLVVLLALLSTLLCMMAWWLKVLLAVLVVLAARHSLRRLAGVPVVAAGCSADQAWTLRLHGNEDIPAALVSFRVLGDFVLLRLHTATHGMQVLLLAPDNSDADIRRRLRMRLATIQPAEALPRL